jgi:hypothetical protein
MPRTKGRLSDTFKVKVTLEAIKWMRKVAGLSSLHQVYAKQMTQWKRPSIVLE